MAKNETTAAVQTKTRKPREATVYELERKIVRAGEGDTWSPVITADPYPDTESAKKAIGANKWEGEFRVVVVKWQGKATKKVAESIELT